MGPEMECQFRQENKGGKFYSLISYYLGQPGPVYLPPSLCNIKELLFGEGQKNIPNRVRGRLPTSPPQQLHPPTDEV